MPGFNEKPPISKCALYSIMIAMLLTGTLNTIVMKYMDETRSPCPQMAMTINGTLVDVPTK